MPGCRGLREFSINFCGLCPQRNSNATDTSAPEQADFLSGAAGTRGFSVLTVRFPRRSRSYARVTKVLSSIPHCLVDFLQKRAASFDAADVRGDLRHQLRYRRPPRDMRHDGDFGVQPERALRRQGFGP